MNKDKSQEAQFRKSFEKARNENFAGTWVDNVNCKERILVKVHAEIMWFAAINECSKGQEMILSDHLEPELNKERRE